MVIVGNKIDLDERYQIPLFNLLEEKSHSKKVRNSPKSMVSNTLRLQPKQVRMWTLFLRQWPKKS